MFFCRTARHSRTAALSNTVHLRQQQQYNNSVIVLSAPFPLKSEIFTQLRLLTKGFCLEGRVRCCSVVGGRRSVSNGLGSPPLSVFLCVSYGNRGCMFFHPSTTYRVSLFYLTCDIMHHNKTKDSCRTEAPQAVQHNRGVGRDNSDAKFTRWKSQSPSQIIGVGGGGETQTGVGKESHCFYQGA